MKTMGRQRHPPGVYITSWCKGSRQTAKKEGDGDIRQKHKVKQNKSTNTHRDEHTHREYKLDSKTGEGEKNKVRH